MIYYLHQEENKMEVFFEGKKVVYVRHDYDYTVEMSKQEIADFLTGKGTNNFVIERNAIQERTLMMAYLPFISHIFLNNFYSDEWKKLNDNEIKIIFHNTANSPIIITVSKELHDFLSRT